MQEDQETAQIIKSFIRLGAKDQRPGVASSFTSPASSAAREAGGGRLAGGGGGGGGAERDAGKKQRVQEEAAVVVVLRREHRPAMIIRSLLLDQRHLQKLVLVRQRGKKRMRSRTAWTGLVVEARKAGLQQLAAPLHARI